MKYHFRDKGTSLFSFKKAQLVFLIMLSFLFAGISLQAENIKTIDSRLADFQTVKSFSEIHIWKNELSLTYLASENDSSQYCIMLCLQNDQCVASNYYQGKQFKTHSGQCWLFSKIDLSTLSAHQPCCELAVMSARVKPELLSSVQSKING